MITDENRFNFNLLHSLRCAIQSDNLSQVINILSSHPGFHPDNYLMGSYSPFHSTCSEGAKECLNYFLKECHCNPNSTSSPFNMTPAHLAAIHGKPELLEVLFEAGADFTIVDINGENILHKATLRGELELIKTLIEKYNLKELLITGDKRGILPCQLLHEILDKRIHPLLLRKDGENFLTDLQNLLVYLDMETERVKNWKARKNAVFLRILLSNRMY